MSDHRGFFNFVLLRIGIGAVSRPFVFLFVFFKQKTAYEIPKRDWSSDVCSSDLLPPSFRPVCRGPGESPSSRPRRSEEHTSELQSRFGISYAVFCLKKNTTNKVTDRTGNRGPIEAVGSGV